jgi:hypothetical protein
MKSRLSSLHGIVVITALISGAVLTQADPVTFVIDPSQSHLSLSGLITYQYPSASNPGLPSLAQTSGSLFDQWNGTLAATLNGNVLTFTGGSVVTAAANPNAPFVGNPTHTTGIDNYGIYASGLVSGVGALSITGSYQGLVLDIPLGTAENGQTPSGMSLQFTGGAIEYSGFALALGGAFTGTSGLNSGTNTTAGLVSLTYGMVGDIEYAYLTLPIQFRTTGGSGRVEDWSGQIVAAGVIPEPSSVAVALLGMGLLVAQARARARRD